MTRQYQLRVTVRFTYLQWNTQQEKSGEHPCRIAEYRQEMRSSGISWLVAAPWGLLRDLDCLNLFASQNLDTLKMFLSSLEP